MEYTKLNKTRGAFIFIYPAIAFHSGESSLQAPEITWKFSYPLGKFQLNSAGTDGVSIILRGWRVTMPGVRLQQALKLYKTLERSSKIF